MREIRQSGSEGGEPQPNAASLPLSKIAVDVFEGRRFWVVHHLAMVATKIAVDVFEGRRFRVIQHLAMVATGLAIPFIDLACPTRIRLLDTDSSP